MTKFFKKSKKTIFGPLWALFAQIWANMNFPGKKGLGGFSMFELSTILPKIIKA